MKEEAPTCFRFTSTPKPGALAWASLPFPFRAELVDRVCPWFRRNVEYRASAGHLVAIPKQHTYSASQVETAGLCTRKWAFTKIGKLRYPDKPSAALGTAVHEELEGYLAGEPIDFARADQAGYIAAAGLHLLPAPGAAGMHIESGFDFSSVATRFRWIGRKDLEVDNTSIFPPDASNPEEVLGGVPGVSDHKSTSGIGWAKTPSGLMHDVQANLYAYELATRRDAPEVDLVWTYYQTRGARTAKRTHLRVLREHAEAMFGLIEGRGAASDMASIERACPAEFGTPEAVDYCQTLTPNPRACTAYGGCEHQHVCVLTLRERMRSIMPSNESKGSFLQGLLERAKEGRIPPATPEINPPESKTPEPIRTLPPVVEAKPKTAEELVAQEKTLVGEEAAIVQKAIAEAVAKVETEGNVHAEAPDAKAPEKPKRGRKPSTSTEAAEPVTENEPATPARTGYKLFVDCQPVKGHGPKLTSTAAMLVEQAREIVREGTKSAENPEGLADYRFAPFGQGPGMLALAVKQIVTSAGFADVEAVILDTRTPEGLVLLGVLFTHATQIVQAFK